MTIEAPPSRLHAGSEVMSALETYVRERRPELARLCAHYTGDWAAADDLTQETLYEAWRRLDRLDDAEALPRWVAGIARNVCRRWLRAHGRDLAHLASHTERDAMDTNDANTALDEVADGADDFTLDLEREELAAALDQALALLLPETRAVVLARLLDDVPQSEVA
ncbi:MAG: RNA polymerase sigma factor, partial [Ktedonobacterales bacterium]